MSKKRRTYQPRIVGGKVMMPADLRRLHKYMLDIERIEHITDEMRAVVESEWPEDGSDHQAMVLPCRHCTYYPVANDYAPWGYPVWESTPKTRCFFAPMHSS